MRSENIKSKQEIRQYFVVSRAIRFFCLARVLARETEFSELVQYGKFSSLVENVCLIFVFGRILVLSKGCG